MTALLASEVMREIRIEVPDITESMVRAGRCHNSI